MFATSSLTALVTLALTLSSSVASPVASPLYLPTYSTYGATPEQGIEPNPPITIARRFAATLGNGSIKLADMDRDRVKTLLQKGQAAANNGTESLGQHRRAASFASQDNAVTYTVNIGIGTPATQYTLIVDTGSSNTWVGASKAYTKTKSTLSLNKSISVSYGSGKVYGSLYSDTVTLTSGLVAVNQSIGVATSATGFTDVDGILGLGPAALTQGTIVGVTNGMPSANLTNTLIPTVSDTLYATKNISTEVLGVSFAPSTSRTSTNGQLTFGGVDSTKFTGNVTYTNITKSSPAKYYWGVDQSIVYGNSSTNIMSSTAGIVDTGTTLVLIPSDAFKRYQSATGATMDAGTGLLTISSANYSKLQSLFFTIGGTKFEFTANAQTWPRSLNTYVGGSSSNIYLIIGDVGYNAGSGLDFINGFTFLQRFYSVYDSTNARVGIASTSNTKATTN